MDLRGEIQYQPFPHLITDNWHPDYEELRASRPPWQKIAPPGALPNTRHDLNAEALLIGKTGKTPRIWLDFVQHYTSPAWWQQIRDKFNLDLPAKCGIRFISHAPIALDCQIGINTPGLGRVRGPHMDNKKEIFALLWYMGEGGGGDLKLYEPCAPLEFHGKREIHDHCVREVKTVPYGHNRMVCFLAKDAIHGVSPRTLAEPRYLVNIIAEYA